MIRRPARDFWRCAPKKMNNCNHQNIECLNQYELIRKYKCHDCLNIMMCSCDQEHGERFLSHQLREGCWEKSQKREPVTLGFQENICPECRGEKPVPAPKASMPGSTTKITRYYWREIAFETTKRFYQKFLNLNPDNWEDSEFSYPEERRIIEKEVISDIKTLHTENPKYDYQEVSQSEILKTTNTEVIQVSAVHVPTDTKKVGIVSGGNIYTVEEFASNYFLNQGFKSLETESIPFHVLFGIFMWPVIQDPNDIYNRVVNFGSRAEYDRRVKQPSNISTLLPTDFGTSEYFERRKDIIIEHLSMLQNMRSLFDSWFVQSEDLRQYLWAHREKDIILAKKLLDILSENEVKRILQYISRNYWSNFCGWPDLLIYNENDLMFVEVKSSNDKLSEDQKNWLIGNNKHMKFGTKIFKVTKSKAQQTN